MPQQLEREEIMLQSNLEYHHEATKRKEPDAVIWPQSKLISAKPKNDSANASLNSVKSKRKVAEVEKKPEVSKKYSDPENPDSGTSYCPRKSKRKLGCKH
uniref:Uncharacterized protein n=1 Tax=Hyaloperonospora arabidopsidis (strain Emoy2) TaxID=559515 RepID=M4C1G6_HYAAE